MAGLIQGVSMLAGMGGSAYSSYKNMGKGVAIAGFLLEAAVSEKSGISFNKTKYPVESGGVISDHIFKKQPTLKIDGEVSAMTMGYVSGISGIIKNGLSTKSFMSGIASGKRRMTDAKKALEKIAEEEMPITIVTGIDVYEDYTIDSIDFDRDNTAERLKISITMSKIYKAHASWAEITRQSTVQKVARKGGSSKRSGGAAKQTASGTEQKQGSGQSLAIGIANGVGKVVSTVGALFFGR